MSSQEVKDQIITAPASILPTTVHDTYIEEGEKNLKKMGCENPEEKPTFYQRFRLPIHIAAIMLYTGYMIATWILHGRKSLVPSLLWAFVSLKVMFYHVPTSVVSKPIGWVFSQLIRFAMRFSSRVRWIVSVVFTVAFIVGITLGLPVVKGHSTLTDRVRSLGGLCAFILLLYATSTDRKRIRWATVISGILLQFILGLFILKTSVGYDIFNWLSNLCTSLLEFSNIGLQFIVGDNAAKAAVFAATVLPAVLFFCAIVKIVYYFGVVPSQLSQPPHLSLAKVNPHYSFFLSWRQ
ncbi:hypothetical protein K7432_017486 [Basidiobolus ranarum]|uniref:Concentrative nucleoside transporter N-terminal domain-containing protein n=1 Tax=Basidiobolus ranarum TaxID=34480 RepID=A0ABR2VKA9_9FUNG